MDNSYIVDNAADVFLQELKDQFDKCYSALKEREIIIYGAGGYGKMMVMALTDIGMRDNIIAVCDSDSKKWGNTIEGIPVCGIGDISADIKKIIIIASQFEKEIRKGLNNCAIEIFKKPLYQKLVEERYNMYYKNTPIHSMGFRLDWFKDYRENLLGCERKILPLLADEKSRNIVLNRIEFYKTGRLEKIMKIPVDDKEYFDTSIYPLSDSEIYVDCGAYIGDTIVDFMNTVETFKEIYAFEPDPINFEKLDKTVGKMKDREHIHIFPYATGEKEGKLRFEMQGGLGSLVSHNGEVEVLVKTLDDVISDKVSLIKMDIEGFELAALKGAKRIIQQYKPKLAICIYHKCEDMFTIPSYLHELVPEYKLKIRQHSDNLYDIVLYAYV